MRKTSRPPLKNTRAGTYAELTVSFAGRAQHRAGFDRAKKREASELRTRIVGVQIALELVACLAPRRDQEEHERLPPALRRRSTGLPEAAATAGRLPMAWSSAA